MCRRPARLGPPLLALVALGLVLGTAPARAGVASTAPDRLLVVAIPHLLWEDVTPEGTPHLWRFAEDAAVAALATRVTDRTAEPGEAYATIGAGNRAVAPGDLASRAMAPDEPYGLGTAADEFRRFTGRPLDGVAGLLTIGALQDANDGASFGGEVGTVGDLLVEEGFEVSVVANADQPRPIDHQALLTTGGEPAIDLHREAVAALMTSDGLVAGGRVDPGLRRADPEAALGTRLDPEAVLAAATEALDGSRRAVLVELSDLLVAERGSRSATEEAAERLEERARTWTDELFGSLLAEAADEGVGVLLVSPSPGRSPHLTVLAVQAPGWRPGLLESAQTRQPGFVTITDIGPTVLSILGLEQPRGIEGRPAVVGEPGGRGADRIRALADADTAARARDRIHGAVSVFYVWMGALLVVGAAAACSHRRLARPVRLLGLWLVATLPFTYLAGPVGLAESGAAVYILAVSAAGAALSAAVLLAGHWLRPQPLRPLEALTALVLLDMAVIAVSVAVLDSTLQVSTVFGDSPIVAGRFSGVNNATFAQLAAGAIVVAAIAVRADRRRGAGSTTRGLWVAGAVLGGVLLVDGLPMWGADVGGVLAAVPAFAITWLALAGRRPRWRALVMWSGVTVLVIGLLGLLDLTRPSEDRSHLGRLFERIADDGLRGLWLVVDRKLDQNLRTITGQPWTWLLVVAVAAIAYVLWRHRDQVVAAFRPEPELRAAARGMAVALVLGFALNDSGVAVPGIMLLVALPVAVWIVLPAEPGPGRQERRDRRLDDEPAGAQPSAPPAGELDERESAAAATSGTLVTIPSTPNDASDTI